VGYDDDRDVRLSGAQAALPVWTDFMKAAAAEPQYHDAQDFAMPPGIVTATVDLHTNPGDSVVTRTEYFIEGTEPQPASGGVAGIISKIFHLGKSPDAPAAAVAAPAVAPRALYPAPVRNARPATPAGVTGGDTSAAAPDPGTVPKPPAKKGAFRKFLSIFKGGDHKKQPAESSQQ